MTAANYFYHATTKKYIALFGLHFNKLSVARNDAQGDKVQQMVVPISYGPYQKFMSRLVQEPDFGRKPAITLPRMAFEIDGINYDSSRKTVSSKKISFTDENQKKHVFVPTPWNIDFTLYILVKYAEDGTQIVEQILPFFRPERTTSVELIEGVPPFDVVLQLNNITMEDIYEGEFETRRMIMWTASFTMKCWYFGPIRTSNVIKFIDIDYFTRTDVAPDTSGEFNLTIQPGLTPQGTPTTEISQTIPYQEINFGDDWGIITLANYQQDGDNE